MYHLGSDGDPAARLINIQTTNPLNPITANRFGVCRPRSTAQGNVDTRLQLVERKRLGEEIVRSEVKANRRIVFPLRRATDDHWHVATSFEVCAQHQPITVGQDEVQHDHVGTQLSDCCFGLAPPIDVPDGIASVAQRIGQHCSQAKIVLDEQNLGRRPLCDHDALPRRVELQYACRLALARFFARLQPRRRSAC